jgi:hypothetical protein
MTWFEDLTPYSYLAPYSYISRITPATSPPTLNVAWLERNRWFPQGAASNAFIVRLGALVEHARTQDTRGWKFCSLCPPTNESNINWSNPNESHACGNAEIRAVGRDGIRYASPTLVLHYVTVHNYAPPQVFVDAVLRTGIDWDSARAGDLCMACGSKMERDLCMAYLSKMARTRTAHARRASNRETLVELLCATCGTSYARVLALEQRDL